MKLLFSNNANTTLAALPNAAATTLQLSSAAEFPIPGAGQAFYGTIFQLSGSTPINVEVVLVTAVSGVNLTVTRGQDGTSAINYAGLGGTTFFELRLTAGGAAAMLQSSENLADIANAATARANLGLGTIATQNAASVTITGGSITGINDLAVADGGTGASTFTAGFLKASGTSPFTTVASIALGSDVSGTLPIGSGGTGQTAKAAAYDALSPNTTLGDIEYRGASNTVRLAGNTTAAKQFLTQTGTGAVSAAPAWAAITNGDIPAALSGKDISGGSITLPSGTGSTTDGVVQWDGTADLLTVGTGAATKTMVDTNSTQTITGKTINLANNTLTATSAQIAAAVSDETGTGSLVFSTSPILTTPNLGTPSVLTLTNATGLPTAGMLDNSVTNAKLRDSAALTVIGRASGTSGDPADIAAVSASGAVLRESGGAIGFGTIATAGIANSAVTYAKVQNVSATDRLLGRATIGAGVIEEITCTAFARSILDDADAGTVRATLGLGTLATQSGTFSGASSGTNTGDQTITLTGPVTGSGTGSFATTITAGAVTYAKIQNVSATDKLLGRATAGAGVVEEIACTAAGRALLDDVDAAAQRATLGLGTLATASTVAVTSVTGMGALVPDFLQSATSANFHSMLSGKAGTGNVVFDNAPSIASPSFTGTPTAEGASWTNLGTVGTVAINGGTATLSTVRSSAEAIGYATGAGGSVTQATSKTTTVTLHKAAGQITMNAASMNAGDEVSFLVLNNKVTSESVVSVAGSYLFNSPNDYEIKMVGCDSGAFRVKVKNISAGTLSESVIINFVVFNGATS